jgi:transcription elongation factor GreA
MAERIPMTRSGYAKLEADLKQMKAVERPRIVREIEAARAHGDISENAEFHAAKERQSHIETRIRQIEDQLARAQVIDPTGSAPTVVRFGVTVHLLDTESDEEVRYTIVGEIESDAASGKISVTSPIARALLGRAVDETVVVRVPKGTREFSVLAISLE